MELHGTVSCIVPYSKDDIDVFFAKTFANIEDNYQKDLHKIARIDWQSLRDWFTGILSKAYKTYIKKYKLEKESIKVGVILERPMINASRFKQSNNASRAFEATLIVLEMLDLKQNYIIIDSKKWQHYFFGKCTIDIDLKEASMKKGIEFLKTLKKRKFRDLCDLIRLHGDADSLLISKFALDKLV